ncbi:uncharacterized protein [Fopius arisanus]|uniref:AGC-kinase C-terminal domain-containing protein n=1 Tax=Fopius arisanus TaxID=64838 RepID=A0A9R1T389_9HYME|nr:PREDICTED: uncharacterized protein LOC105265873 [Fopius arisanus]
MSYYGDSMSYYYGGAFANHSSLMTGTGRIYTPLRFAPHLSTISESPLSNYRRYTPVVTSLRPKRIIDTADIDVSTPRTLHTDHSRPGNRLRRDRPTIRIRSQALKDNPTLREHNERHEKTVGELLREKFFIKDKKSTQDTPKHNHLVNEATDDTSEAPQGRLTRRMTRRRSSADIQMDPGQLERELAIAQVQAEVLDNLVAEEQAEIEVEVRRGTLLHKSQLRSAGVSKSESEADKTDDSKKKIPKKIKKKKKTTEKPSPPSSTPSTPSTPADDVNNTAKLFKIEASNSVGDFSTILINSKDNQKRIDQFRESIRLPPPKPSKMECSEEEVVVLPIKKPYIHDNSRNSVYLTVKQQIAKSSGPRDDDGGTNQISPRFKMDRVKNESDLKLANIRAKDKLDTEDVPINDIDVDEIDEIARCGITSTQKGLMKTSEESSRGSRLDSVEIINSGASVVESAVENTHDYLNRNFEKDVCEIFQDMPVASEDSGEGVWELPGAGLVHTQEGDQDIISEKVEALFSPGKGDGEIVRKKEDETESDCSELKITNGEDRITAVQTDILKKNKTLNKLESSLSQSKIPDDCKVKISKKEKLDKSKSLSIESKIPSVSKSPIIQKSKGLDESKSSVDTTESKKDKSVEKSKSLSTESRISSVSKSSIDEMKSPKVENFVDKAELSVDNRIASISTETERTETTKFMSDSNSSAVEKEMHSEDRKTLNETSCSPVQTALPLVPRLEMIEKEPLEKAKSPLEKEAITIKIEGPEKINPLSKSNSLTDSSFSSLSAKDLKPKSKMAKSKYLSTDSGIGSLELDPHQPEKKSKKKLQSSKGSSFECDQDSKSNLLSSKSPKKVKRSDKAKVPPVKKLKKKITSAKTLPLPLINDSPTEIILTRVSSTEEIPVKGPFKSLRSFPLAKSEPKLLPSLNEDEKTDEIDFWSEINKSSPPKIDRPKLSLKLQLPDEIIKDQVKQNTSEIIQEAITKEEVKLPEAIFDNSLSSENSLTSERNCETGTETRMEILLSQVSEIEPKVPGDYVKLVEIVTPVEAVPPVTAAAAVADDKPLSEVCKKPEKNTDEIPDENSEPSTPVVEIPLAFVTPDPIATVPQVPEDQIEDEDDSPTTPTNEDTSGCLSKWEKATDLTTLDGKNVPSSGAEAGNEVATPKVSKKKLSRRKKSVSEDTIIRRVPDKITSGIELSKACAPLKILKTSPPKPAKRPIDLNKMFYTTPSSLLTATPRDLAKVKRVKVKKEKHPVRTPSASSDSTGSTRSSQGTASSRSNSTEIEDESGQKRISSTRSNDSGFDGSPRLSNCEMACHKKCEKLTGNLCGLNQKLVAEALQALKRAPSQSSDNQRNSDSSDHVHGSGRITPPATNLPRFKKYTVEDFHFLKVSPIENIQKSHVTVIIFVILLQSLSWDRLERRQLDPPFKPALEHTLDTRYFDTAFTAEKPRLTPVPEQILTSMDQGVFRGFSYTNPNATD